MAKSPRISLHEIEFYEPPTKEQLTAAVDQYIGGGKAYRCVSISDDKTTFVIEEVDIRRAASGYSLKLQESTMVVPTTIVCATCKAEYQVLFVDFATSYSSKRNRHFTKYCPQCPPMSVDAWIGYLGYYTEELPPEREEQHFHNIIEEEQKIESSDRKMNIDMADFD